MDTHEPMMMNAVGHYVPTRLVRPDQIAQDEAVRKMIAGARGLHAVLLQFRTTAFRDADAFLALLAAKYQAAPRSAANATLTTFDGLMKVEIATGHFLTFGPELQAAKSLIDECVQEWSAGANVNLQALVNNAFAVGDGGKIRVDRVLALRRVEITDAKWQRAMSAISDAVQVTHSKRYIRFHVRENHEAPWKQIPLDVARLS
jgi:hypothetical protein